MAESNWSLPRPVNAPVLEPFVIETEEALKGIEAVLGDQSARATDAKETSRKITEKIDLPKGTGAMIDRYDELGTGMRGYLDAWTALDDQIGMLSLFAALDANLVAGRFETMKNAIIEVLAAVEPSPSTATQYAVINAIYTILGDTVREVMEAQYKLGEKSAEVPVERGSSGGSPSGSGSGASYLPPSWPSSSGDTEYRTDTSLARGSADAAPLGAGEKVKVQEIYNYLVDQCGFTPAQAAGILGNMQVESGFDTGAYNPAEGAIGLCQWLGGRREALEAFAADENRSVTDWKTQVDFMVKELNGSEKHAGDLLRGAKTATEAAEIFDAKYERSSGAARPQRVANAANIANTLVAV